MSREPGYDDRYGRLDERDRGPRDPARGDRYPAEGRGRDAPPDRRTNWAATGALICGIAGLITLFMFPPLGILLAAIAVVLAIVGLVKARHPYTGGTGQAIIGLVTGVIALLITALVIWGITALFQNADFQDQLQEQIEQLEGQVGE